ncbi:PriCT-2 domain-containing protein [Bradyrhizobium sp. LA7.1]|uniref:PriCT-2 domain-containing protein n=1 Tax=Bradyrhizobium sp. LA7.1 TaxID=3156324 RepID=UPI00339ABAF5
MRRTRVAPERVTPSAPPAWWVRATVRDTGRGLSFDPHDSDDNELKIQYALDAIPKSRSHIGYLDWVKIGGMVFCALGEDGFDIWHEWSAGGDPGSYLGEESCRVKWIECCKFTEFGRDGASIFLLADKSDTRRVWRRAYATAHAKLLMAEEARCILARGGH